MKATKKFMLKPSPSFRALLHAVPTGPSSSEELREWIVRRQLLSQLRCVVRIERRSGRRGILGGSGQAENADLENLEHILLGFYSSIFPRENLKDKIFTTRECA